MGRKPRWVVMASLAGALVGIFIAIDIWGR